MVQVDIGHESGLQRGDSGTVYFEVASGGDLLSVEVGIGRVVETAANTAAVVVDRTAVVEPGHLVRFEIPELRLVRPETPRRESRPPPSTATVRVSSNVSPCLNVRPLPAQFSAPVDCLPAGTPVEIIETLPSWTRIRLPDRSSGWVSTAFLDSRRASASPSPAAPREDRSNNAELETMHQRLADTQAALDVSETARAELQRQLEEAEEAAGPLDESESLEQLRARLDDSSIQLVEIRNYHTKLRTALSRRILAGTIADLEEQLLLTADDLQRTAAERDQLAARLASLEGETPSEDERSLAEIERQLQAANARNAEMEIELDLAAARILELTSGAADQPPAIAGALESAELSPATSSPPAPADPPLSSVSETGRQSAVDTTEPPRPRADATGPATRIEQIVWRQEEGSIVFYVVLDGRVSKEDCSVVRVRSGAPRDVLKIKGLRKGLSPSSIDVGVGFVERLRAGLHWQGDDSEMHLVTDLARGDVGIRTVRIRGNILVVKVS